jgi:hypothetical protein
MGACGSRHTFQAMVGGGRWMTAFVCCWGASGDGACLAHATSDGGSFPSNVGSDGVSVVCLCIFPYFLCISYSLIFFVFHSVSVIHKCLLDLFVGCGSYINSLLFLVCAYF